MKNLLNMVKMTKPNRNAFDLTHDVKLSLNMGKLVPTCCVETVPGDKFHIQAESLLRFAPLVSPVMHKFDVTHHYFFVPRRLVNFYWEQYITNSETPMGTLAAEPTFVVDENTWSPLLDYFGIPKPLPGQSETINPTALAAYQLIWAEYYRDQNLIEYDKNEFMLGPGDMTDMASKLNTLRQRAWEHDYFTSALPFAQKGAAVELPLGEVRLADEWGDGEDGRNPSFVHVNQDGIGNPIGDVTQNSSGGIAEINIGVVPGKNAYDPDGTLEVGSTTINDLRRAFRLQEWLEKTARGGSRYVENILAHFGVKSSDARMQRPEYITGSKSPVIISEIVNTTGTVEAPQGNMSGHALSVTSGKSGHYFCEEHGYIIGIMSVMPKTAYQQGIPKHFLKYKDPFQYFWPSFAHIGEQPIENREIYAYQGAAGDNVFGYVPRYAEYKFEQNRVAGDFRDTLDFWHLGRIFAAPPALNQTFVECNPDHRIFAVTDPAEQKLYCHVVNKITAIRPMPKFGTPTF